MEENKNTFPFKSNIVIEGEKKPEAYVHYQYVPEEGDNVVICKSIEEVEDRFLEPPSETCSELYYGDFPMEYNKPGDDKKYRFFGYKINGVRSFFLYERRTIY